MTAGRYCENHSGGDRRNVGGDVESLRSYAEFHGKLACHSAESDTGLTILATHQVNVATKGGVGSKNDRRAGTRFFEPGGYKIEPLLIKQ